MVTLCLALGIPLEALRVQTLADRGGGLRKRNESNGSVVGIKQALGGAVRPVPAKPSVSHWERTCLFSKSLMLDMIIDAFSESRRWWDSDYRLAPLKFEPKPGMPVAAYIKTRERTPLELWLDPLIGGIRKSMRET